jgi:hypothetical protein
MAEHDLQAVAFPKLSEAQIEQLGRYAGAAQQGVEENSAIEHGIRAKAREFQEAGGEFIPNPDERS